MKIGIITFHRAINYGAVLQAFALQTVLNNMGYTAEIIDYRCSPIEAQYKLCDKLKSSKSIKYTIYLLLKKAYPSIIKKLKIESFIKKYLNLSAEYDSGNISSAREVYDKFITGSDQVWNYNHSNFDKAYFLDFIDDSRRKFSYAASFGFSHIPDDKINDYRRLLDNYDIISLREKSGVNIVNNLFPAKKAIMSSDPVLLLDGNQWSKYFDINKPLYENYVLVYELMPSESLRKYAYEIAKKNNCRVIHISETVEKNNYVKNLYGVSPCEFLSLIKNAQAVCTNSFHGTAFSLNFNTPICVELLKETMSSLNTRIVDLLDLVGAGDRIISDTLEPFEMQYTYINKKLAELRNESLSYLKKLGDEKI